jgi:hypothetical protein
VSNQVHALRRDATLHSRKAPDGEAPAGLPSREHGLRCSGNGGGVTSQRDDVSRPAIFISHRESDAEIARILQQAMEGAFLRLPRFFNASDDISLQPGDSWFSTLMSALKKCDVLLALLSPAGRDSPWVNFESGAAWLRGAKVVPCCIGQVRKSSLPEPYSQLQAVNLDEPRDLANLIQRVAGVIGMDSGEVDHDDLASRISIASQAIGADQTSSAGSMGSRLEHLAETEWRYSRSEIDPSKWAACCVSRRRFRVLVDELASIENELAPALEAVSFSSEHPPVATLKDDCSRSSSGTIRLAPPHIRTGGKFAVRTHFDPPLRRGDEALVHMSIDLPVYRLGVREDLIAALLDADATTRDYDFTGRSIQQPTELFIYRAIIPEELGAAPLSPEVRRFQTSFPEEQEYVFGQDGVFTISEDTIDGSPSWILELKRHNPPYRTLYRLRWRLPRRADL